MEQILHPVGALLFTVSTLISFSMIKDGDYGLKGMWTTLIAGFGAALMLI